MDKPLTKSELAERVDAVDYDIGRPWHSSDAPALQFSFQFETSPADDFPWSDVSGFFDWTEVKKDNVRTALNAYSEVINVDFTETTGASDPDFSFYLAVNGLSGGRGRFDYFGTEWDGSAVFNAYRALNANDHWIVLHELGHTLGLKHTGDYDAGGNLPPGPFLSSEEDIGRNTVMSYNWNDPDYGVVDNLGVFDIKALQDRFGANMSHNEGKTVYTGPQNGSFFTVWDGAGRDLFDASTASGSVSIDLRSGMISDFAQAGSLAIAYGAVIENAIGGASGDDLTGNKAANLLNGMDGDDFIFGLGGNDRLLGQGGNDVLNGAKGKDWIKAGAGDDVIKAGKGADRIIEGLGDDRIDGGAGFDVLVVTGGRSDYTLTQQATKRWEMSDGRFTDTLINIEKIRFADDTLDL